MLDDRIGSNLTCHECGTRGLEEAPGYRAAHRVTSDCKPWPAGGILARCRWCGLVQTVTTQQWREEADQIYANYSVYHQSGGREQPVFNAATGVGRSRSDAIVEALRRQTRLVPQGRLLDVGCGNGAFLRAFGKVAPGWRLCGSEVGDRNKRDLEGIPGFDRFFSGSIEGITGSYDLISMIHVIEHIPGPSAFLKELACRLNPGGHLLLEVPDCAANGFILMVADHCSHFSTGMLDRVVTAAGFTPLATARDWVPKEISMLARWTANPRVHLPTPRQTSDDVFHGWNALQEIVPQAGALRHEPGFGLFGTSIAATWLDTQLNQAAQYFVDEDPHRIGKQHLGRPIIAPEQMPQDGTLYVALPAPIAGAVVARLRAARPDLQITGPT